MRKDTTVIREIKPEDNAQIEAIIRACFYEFKIPIEGTAYTNNYETNGFKHLKGALGNTGHHSCGVWMIKEI